MRPVIGWSLLVGVGIVVGYVAAVRLRPTVVPPKRGVTVATAEETRTVEPPGDSQELRTRLAALEAQIQVLRASVAERPEAGSAVPAPGQAPTEASPAVPTEASIVREKQEWHEHMVEVQAEYELEPPDPHWSRETHDLLRGALGKLPTLSKSVQSLECRSETCRLELVDDHTGNFAKELPTLQLGLGGQLPTIHYDYAEEPNGNLRTILYLSRHADTPDTMPPG